MTFCPTSSDFSKNNALDIIYMAVLIFRKLLDLDQNSFSRPPSPGNNNVPQKSTIWPISLPRYHSAHLHSPMQQASSSISKHIPQLALLLAMVLWASSFIGLKLAFRGYDPMVVIFGRMLIASICFLLVGKRLARSLKYRKGDYRLILFMAFCEPCLYFLFEAKAIENTTASQAGLITAMLPILVMITASFLLKEIINRRSWIGAIMAVAGVCWLTAESTPSTDAPNPVLGNFYEFLAMVCATGYTIALKKLTDRYSPFFLTATQSIMGSLFYFPLLFLPGTELPTSLSLVPTLAVFYLGAVITLGAYGLYNFGVKHIPASNAAMYVNLIPVFTVIMGWLILGEKLSMPQCIASLIIMTGVVMSTRQTDS